MRKIVKTNVWLLLLLIILLGYLINYVAIEVVANDNLWQQNLTEKYDKKYKEYKDLDIDLSEFKDELKEFEQQPIEDDSYGWDYFYTDSIMVLVPILTVTIGYSVLLLLLLLFHKRLNIIKYLNIVKITIVSYLIFYVPDLISNIYLLVFKPNYKFTDIGNFNSYFTTTHYFNKENFPDWLWTIMGDIQPIYIIFPLLIALGLKSIYKQFPLGLLLMYCYLTYLISFIFLEIIMWYLFVF